MFSFMKKLMSCNMGRTGEALDEEPLPASANEKEATSTVGQVEVTATNPHLASFTAAGLKHSAANPHVELCSSQPPAVLVTPQAPISAEVAAFSKAIIDRAIELSADEPAATAADEEAKALRSRGSGAVVEPTLTCEVVTPPAEPEKTSVWIKEPMFTSSYNNMSASPKRDGQHTPKGVEPSDDTITDIQTTAPTSVVLEEKTDEDPTDDKCAVDMTRSAIAEAVAAASTDLAAQAEAYTRDAIGQAIDAAIAATKVTAEAEPEAETLADFQTAFAHRVIATALDMALETGSR